MQRSLGQSNAAHGLFTINWKALGYQRYGAAFHGTSPHTASVFHLQMRDNAALDGFVW